MARIIARSEAPAPPGMVTRDWRACAARVERDMPLRSQAATMLLNARTQARTIIADAQAMARDVVAAEHRQAWDRGYADGMAQARQQLAAIAQRLSPLVSQAALSRDASLRNLDEEVLTLVLAISRAVIRQEVQLAPETILLVAQEALSDMSAGPTVVLRIHPDDEAVLQPSLPMLGLPPSIQVSMVADSTISPGGCLVESGAGRVDGTIETRIERLGDLLREHLHAA